MTQEHKNPPPPSPLKIRVATFYVEAICPDCKEPLTVLDLSAGLDGKNPEQVVACTEWGCDNEGGDVTIPAVWVKPVQVAPATA